MRPSFVAKRLHVVEFRADSFAEEPRVIYGRTISQVLNVSLRRIVTYHVAERLDIVFSCPRSGENPRRLVGLRTSKKYSSACFRAIVGVSRGSAMYLGCLHDAAFVGSIKLGLKVTLTRQFLLNRERMARNVADFLATISLEIICARLLIAPKLGALEKRDDFCSESTSHSQVRGRVRSGSTWCCLPYHMRLLLQRGYVLN